MENETFAAAAAWGPILLMLIIFYFMLYRPNKIARQERDTMLAGLKVGTKIITIGGIYGEITAINEERIKIKIARDVEIEINRNSVGQLDGHEGDSK